MLTYHTATTLDGFIADPDDSLDWLLRQKGGLHGLSGDGFEKLAGHRCSDASPAGTDAKTGPDMPVIAAALITVRQVGPRLVDHPHQRWSQEFGPVAKLWRLTKD